ncbi:MAG: hypothetical protein HGA39_09680 [Coriobacteriia bacterium]|nr:hypothetical protein [Coriobacteriia bacterium]
MGKITPAHRAILTFALLAAIAVPTAAYASSYWSSMYLLTAFDGGVRYYNGNNVGISMTASCASYSARCFSVDLYKYRAWYWSDWMGSSAFPRNGYGSHNWFNVGSGNYYFHFTNWWDGAAVYSGNVHMYSY